MAGDWIKMRVGLWTHPKVITIASRLSVTSVTEKCDRSVTRAHVIGALHCAWSIADQHSDENGRVEMTSAALDSICETPGLANVMQAVGWLVIGQESLQFVDYQEHNGSTAKQRAESQRRQRVSRKRHASVTEKCDKTVTREEKRREEKKDPPNPPEGGKKKRPAKPETSATFAGFWSAYPRHDAKKAAAAAFAKLDPSPELLTTILAAIESQKRPGGALELRTAADGRSVVPHAASWLNGRRWEDEPVRPPPPQETPEQIADREQRRLDNINRDTGRPNQLLEQLKAARANGTLDRQGGPDSGGPGE